MNNPGYDMWPALCYSLLALYPLPVDRQ